MFGKEFQIRGIVFPASKEDYDYVYGLSQKVSSLLGLRFIKPMKINLWEGGLERVAEALQYLEDGKISAEKLVIKL